MQVKTMYVCAFCPYIPHLRSAGPSEMLRWFCGLKDWLSDKRMNACMNERMNEQA